MPHPRPSLADLPRRRIVELLMLALAVFVAWRVALPQQRGAEAARTEQEATSVLRAIHAAQGARRAQGGAFVPLSELVRDAGADDALRSLAPHPSPPDAKDVEVYRRGPYLFALYRDDPAGARDRAWSSRADDASGRIGGREYGAFAWPLQLDETVRWTYFVSHRGKLLGSANLRGRFAGFTGPFPFPEHPLIEYLNAKSDGKDAVWSQFADLGEKL